MFAKTIFISLLFSFIGDVFSREFYPGSVDNSDHKDDFHYNLEHWTGRWFPGDDPEVTKSPLPIPTDNKDESGGLEDWNGRWFPGKDDSTLPQSSSDVKNSDRIPMGMKLSHCDDGKTNLTVDWDNSAVNYTCDGSKIEVFQNINALVYCEHIPLYYQAQHKCMKDTIEYDDDVPVYGSHRPEWPVYGEYKFIPKQRWLHSLEHGAVVMLYHPCAELKEVNKLKKIVKSCLRRHIISPYTLLDKTRPLVLVTWGCRLTMSHVNFKIVNKFIRKRALHGAEHVYKDGSFDTGLINKAKVVSDLQDSYLCPR